MKYVIFSESITGVPIKCCPEPNSEARCCVMCKMDGPCLGYVPTFGHASILRHPDNISTRCMFIRNIVPNLTSSFDSTFIFIPNKTPNNRPELFTVNKHADYLHTFHIPLILNNELINYFYNWLRQMTSVDTLKLQRERLLKNKSFYTIRAFRNIFWLHQMT